LLSERLGIRL